MSREVLHAALELVGKSERSRVDLLFSGGEPLLEFPLLQETIAYIKAHPHLEKKLRFNLITNGTHLTNSVSDFLVENNFQIQLSYNREPLLTHPGVMSNEIIDDVLVRLQQRHPLFFQKNIQVSLTLSPEMIPHLADMVEALFMHDVPEISLAPSYLPSTSWDEAGRSELERQLKKLRNLTHNYYKQNNKIPLNIFLNQVSLSDKPREMTPCNGLRGVGPAVDANGMVYLCAVFTGWDEKSIQVRNPKILKPFKIGMIQDASTIQRLDSLQQSTVNTAFFPRLTERYSHRGQCHECEFVNHCHVCPAVFALNSNREKTFKVTNYYCDFMYITMKFQKDYPIQS